MPEWEANDGAVMKVGRVAIITRGRKYSTITTSRAMKLIITGYAGKKVCDF